MLHTSWAAENEASEITLARTVLQRVSGGTSWRIIESHEQLSIGNYRKSVTHTWY